jgi:Na+/melibiose symporter-like transporter
LARNTTLDWFGVVLLAGGLTAVLVPLIEGQQEDWPLWTWLSLAGGIVLLFLFALWEISVERRKKSPLVPPRLYKHASFAFGTILALVYFAGFVSIFFTLSILWQVGLGHTPLEAGLVSLPFALGTIVGSSQSSRLAARLGRTVLLIGSAAMAVGLVIVWIIFAEVPGHELTVPSIGELGSILLLEIDGNDISSTDIRMRAARGDSIDGLVPKAVADYIHDHDLYREPRA